MLNVVQTAKFTKKKENEKKNIFTDTFLTVFANKSTEGDDNRQTKKRQQQEQ